MRAHERERTVRPLVNVSKKCAYTHFQVIAVKIERVMRNPCIYILGVFIGFILDDKSSVLFGLCSSWFVIRQCYCHWKCVYSICFRKQILCVVRTSLVVVCYWSMLIFTENVSTEFALETNSPCCSDFVHRGLWLVNVIITESVPMVFIFRWQNIAVVRTLSSFGSEWSNYTNVCTRPYKGHNGQFK